MLIIGVSTAAHNSVSIFPQLIWLTVVIASTAMHHNNARVSW
jgi:hypothetical protein